jgi:hypothetical protein
MAKMAYLHLMAAISVAKNSWLSTSGNQRGS